MKTYPRDAKIDWNEVRQSAYGIHSTDTQVIVYETPEEVPAPNPAPIVERSAVDEELAASAALRGLVDEVAKILKVTPEKLKADIEAKV